MSSSDPHRRDFTQAQLDLAARLANDFAGPQRKDLELLYKMRKKEKLGLRKRRPIDENWEELASQGISKKHLSLDREWNAKTWTIKTSCYERLKMLKDSGVDIAPLQGPDVSSESITRVVIALVDARKRNSSSRDSSQLRVTKDVDTTELPKCSTIALNFQPETAFDHLEYRPLPTLPPKRKRITSLDSDTADSRDSYIPSDDEEPAFKKLCNTDLRMARQTYQPVSEEETPTWPLLKSKILADIFKLMPTTRSVLVRNPSSRIIICFDSQSATEAEPAWAGHLKLNSKGYDNIMSDLRVLSDTLDEHGNFSIHNPAGPAHLPGIRIITNMPRKIVLEGEALALIGLLSRLKTPGKGLAHAAKRFFDDAGERKAVGRVYELGAGTMQELESIQAELESKRDGCEVWVKWVYTGKTELLKDKMY